MRKFLPLFVIFVALLVGILFLKASKQNTSDQTVVDNRIIVTLAEQNSSGQNGSVTIVPTDDTLSITVEVNSINAFTQPAHIHSGTCNKPGPVVVALPFPVNGFAEGEVGTTLDQLKAQLPLIINIHKSEKEANIYTACGELQIR